MTEYDAVKRIIGEIDPVGETNTDEKRYENLLTTIYIVEALLFEIERVSENKDRPEYSMYKAGLRAHNFLKAIGEEESQ